MKPFRMLSLICLIGFGHLQAQISISFTFTATMNGVHQPLDSISIENLTQGGDTMLFGNDTVLVLQFGIGIPDASFGSTHGLILQPAFPNPFNKSTTLRFSLAQQEQVNLRLYDLLGHEVTRFVDELSAGEHQFTLHTGNERFYILSVETPSCKQVQKLIPFGCSKGGCRIEYSGWHAGTTGFKKGKAFISWTPGDYFRFIGFTSTGPDTIDAIPQQSTLFTFQYGASECPLMITDINGNVYNTILIGNQCWMKENLKASTYNNGTTIPIVTSNTIWKGLSTGSRCWYNNDSATYAATYGTLYNWFTVDNTNGLCPTGWHVPSDAEWTILTDFLGGWAIAGGQMKDTSTTHWNSPNIGATNSSGFTAFGAGIRQSHDGNFAHLGAGGFWWSSTTDSTTSYIWIRELHRSHSVAYKLTFSMHNGMSVRCLKD